MEIKIPATALKIGMFLIRTDQLWQATPFRFQGFVVSSPDQINWIKDHCEYVYIRNYKETGKSHKLSPGFSKSGNASAVQRTKRSSRGRLPTWQTMPAESPPSLQHNISSAVGDFRAEMPRAREAYETAKLQVRQLSNDVRLGQALVALDVRKVVGSLVSSVVRNPDALLWLTNLRDRDEYTMIHSLNVCILSVAFGRHLKMDGETLVELGIGGLLHDIGKMRIPTSILNKPGQLTPEEYEVVKMHTKYGQEVLARSTSLPPSASDIALSHHERVDGSGYPRGAKGESLSLFSRLVSVVDFYDAITSNRVYKNATNSTEALEKMYGLRTGAFDEQLVYDFIRFIGLYPAGTLVELRNGNLAVVTATNPHHRTRPVVALVMDADGNLFHTQHLIDLSLLDESEEAAAFTIVRAHDPENLGHNLLETLDEWFVNPKRA